jgi:hypothetical protein
MKLDPATFAKVGNALYGETWQVSLASDLQVNLRTIARWKRGDYLIPIGIWQELADLCLDRGGKLVKIAHEIEKEQ